MFKCYFYSCLSFALLFYTVFASIAAISPNPSLRLSSVLSLQVQPVRGTCFSAEGVSCLSESFINTTEDPLKIVATPSLARSVALRWQSIEGAQQYVIDFSYDDLFYMPLDTISHPLTSYHHGNLNFDQKIFYRVKYLKGNTYSSYSTAEATTHTQDYTYRLMPLGDSNTDGGSPTSVALADRVAYRKELYRLLRSDGLRIDFVGSEQSGMNHEADFRQETGFSLDLDHAGFGGARISDIDSLLEKGYFYFYGDESKKLGPDKGKYLPLYKPDIILLHLGTNQISGSESAITALERLLEHIDQYERVQRKEVTVFLAKIINRVYYVDGEGKDNQAEIDATRAFNRNIAQLAAKRIAAGDRLVLVDMEKAGLNYTFGDNGGDMEDVLHPNASGYSKMASQWFSALKKEFTVPPLPVEFATFELSSATGKVTANWRTSFEADVARFELERVSENGEAQVVGTLQASGTSNTVRSYSFTDVTAPAGRMHYRIKAITGTGKIQYSRVETIQINPLSAASGLEEQAMEVYPNPGNGERVQLSGVGFTGNSTINLLLLDANGKRQWSGQRIANNEGVLHTQLVFRSRLKPGLYVLRLESAEKSRSLKVVIH